MFVVCFLNQVKYPHSILLGCHQDFCRTDNDPIDLSRKLNGTCYLFGSGADLVELKGKYDMCKDQKVRKQAAVPSLRIDDTTTLSLDDVFDSSEALSCENSETGIVCCLLLTFEP